MHRLVRVHNTPHGWGFFTDRGGQLNIAANGVIQTQGLGDEHPHLIGADPDPVWTVLRYDDNFLWLHQLDLNVASCLMIVDLRFHNDTTGAVNGAMEVLNRLAEKAGHYRRPIWMNSSSG